MNNANDSAPLGTKGHWFLSRGSLVACVVLATVGSL